MLTALGGRDGLQSTDHRLPSAAIALPGGLGVGRLYRISRF